MQAPTINLRPLSQLMHEHVDQEPVPGQEVLVDGRPERLQAALQRTAVLGPAETRDGQGRHLVPLDQVLAGDLMWMPLRRLEWNSGEPGAAARGRARAATSVQKRVQAAAITVAAVELSARERQVTELVVTAMSVAEVAAELGIKPSTARVLLHRARAKGRVNAGTV